MKGEIVDGVAGLSEERVAELVAEAEAGYDLEELTSEPNPHFRGEFVPDDLLAAVDERAERDGQSRSEVVRRALREYLAG